MSVLPVIQQSPCGECRFFRTIIIRNGQTGEVESSPRCVAYQMKPDFSCFDERGEGREV